MANQSINIPTTGTFIFLDTITRPVFDFRTRQSGNYDSLATWDMQISPGVWSPATQLPTLVDNIYIEATHTLTLTKDESCKSLNHIAGEALTKLNTGIFALNVYGELRRYTGAAPGTTVSAGNANGTTQWVMGAITMKGYTRAQTMIQWGATANSYGFTFNINLEDITQVLTINGTTGQAFSSGGILNVNVGIFKMAGANIQNRVLLTTAGDLVQNGTVNINNGGTYSNDMTASNLSISKSATVSFATFNLNTGGKFIFRNEIASRVNAITIANVGAVYLDLAGAQILPLGATTGTGFPTYFDLYLQGSGAKTLSQSSNITNKLSFAGTATLALGAFALTYGTTADLEITANKVRGVELPAASSGTAIPQDLIIPTGVVYDLGGAIVNIRGVLTGGGTTANGTLVQNQP